MEPENLPEWLGGTSKGTLLDDVGPWSDPDTLRRMEGQLAVASKTLKRMTSLSAGGGDAGAPLLLDEDGFHSPRCAALLQAGCTCLSSASSASTASVQARPHSSLARTRRHACLPLACCSPHLLPPPPHALRCAPCPARSEASFVSVSSSIQPSEHSVPLLGHAPPGRASEEAASGSGAATAGGEQHGVETSAGSAVLTIAAINAHK